MNRYSRLVFRSWKRCGQLSGAMSRPRFSSREATRQVSHNSDASVGQWMFVSTTVVSARIVAVAIDLSAPTACCPSSSLTRFQVAGRTAWKHRSRKLWSITAFFRVRRKSWRKSLSAIRTTVSRKESPSMAWTINARRIVSEVKSPLAPLAPSVGELLQVLVHHFQDLRVVVQNPADPLVLLRGIRVPSWEDARRCAANGNTASRIRRILVLLGVPREHATPKG